MEKSAGALERATQHLVTLRVCVKEEELPSERPSSEEGGKPREHGGIYRRLLRGGGKLSAVLNSV